MTGSPFSLFDYKPHIVVDPTNPTAQQARVNTNMQIQVTTEGTVPTYRAGATGLTLYSTAAAVLLEIQGSATKTVRIKRIEIWGQAGTKFFTELKLQRATTVGGGAPVAAALGQHDVSDAAATAVVNSYAAASTAGSNAAVIGAKVLGVSPPAASMGAVPAVWSFAANDDKPIILRGASQWLEVYNTITGLGTATFGFEIEWEEDAS